MAAKTPKLDAHEICPGYVDENGIWNTGFYCPRWGGPNQQYCCGDVTRRFCCPKAKTTEAPEVVQYIPIVIGVSVALFVLAAVLFFSCCFCHCCPGYKKRQKRLQKAFEQQLAQQQSHDLPDIAVQASGQPMPDDRDPSPTPGGLSSPQQYSPHTPSACSVAHSTRAEVLHCGCQWSPALPRSPMADLDSIMKQLYGDSNTAKWSPELEPHKEYPIDKPPPYTEHDIHKLGLKSPQKQQQKQQPQPRDMEETESKTLGRRFKERKEMAAAESKVTRAVSDPSQLCMKSFRPMMIRHGQRLDSDTRRDSGVLVEEGESFLEPEPAPFVLQGVHGLHKQPTGLGLHQQPTGLHKQPSSGLHPQSAALPRPGMLHYNSRGSLDVDPAAIAASIHVPEFDQDYCS